MRRTEDGEEGSEVKTDIKSFSYYATLYKAAVVHLQLMIPASAQFH